MLQINGYNPYKQKVLGIHNFLHCKRVLSPKSLRLLIYTFSSPGAKLTAVPDGIYFPG